MEDHCQITHDPLCTHYSRISDQQTDTLLSDSIGSGFSEHRRESSAAAFPPRAVGPQAYDSDDRSVRHSPTRAYKPWSPTADLRRDLYWPEPATSPSTRSPRDNKFSRPNSWGYHSRTPSDSYRSSHKRDGSNSTFKENFQGSRREGSIASLSCAGPTSGASTPSSRRADSSQPDRPQGLSMKLLQDERDSLASTPHDEQQLSRAASPGSSKTPSSPEVTHEGN